MFILRKLLETDSNTPKIKEAISFDPTDTVLIEGNEVAYGLSYKDNGNGNSKAKLLISLLYQSKTYEWDMGINIANEFKDQLSLTLIEDSAEVDKVGVIFPEEGINTNGEKYVKGLTFSTYKIKQSTNAPLVEHLGKTKLQKNINSSNPANTDNSYFQPRAGKIDNGDVIVIAHNLNDQALVSWYLKQDESGNFKALAGRKGITERKLSKFDNPGQLVLDENIMLYSQMRKRIINNQEVKTTNIFKFDVAKVVQDLKDGKGIDDFLLGNRNGQITEAPSLFSEHAISFLQYVKQTEGNDLVAFLVKDQLSNRQMLHLVGLAKGGSTANLPIYEFADSIEQLYVKNDGQDGFIVTAVNEENIITFNKKASGVTILTNSIKTFSNFVGIINGRFMPDISSTVSPITITETVMTSAKASTAAITSTTKTDAVETTKLITETITPTSAMSKPSTESTTQASMVPTTVESTKAAETTVTSKTTVVPTNMPTINPEKTTQTVFTISSTSIQESTTPMLTTTSLPRSTPFPQPTPLIIEGEAGIIAGSVLAITGVIAGIIGFIAYKCVKEHRRRNAVPPLELTDFGNKRQSSLSSSDEEIFNAGNIPCRTIDQPETPLNYVSVESNSRSGSSLSSLSSGTSS